jgi:predicted nucleic acid-binding protein
LTSPAWNGRIFAVATGRKARRAWAVDLLIAATALAHDLPLYTRNGDDFTGLAGLIDIHVV